MIMSHSVLRMCSGSCMNKFGQVEFCGEKKARIRGRQKEIVTFCFENVFWQLHEQEGGREEEESEGESERGSKWRAFVYTHNTYTA